MLNSADSNCFVKIIVYTKFLISDDEMYSLSWKKFKYIFQTLDDDNNIISLSV